MDDIHVLHEEKWRHLHPPSHFHCDNTVTEILLPPECLRSDCRFTKYICHPTHQLKTLQRIKPRNNTTFCFFNYLQLPAVRRKDKTAIAFDLFLCAAFQYNLYTLVLFCIGLRKVNRTLAFSRKKSVAFHIIYHYGIDIHKA